MSGINIGKVVAGGLLAGVIYLVGDFAMAFTLMQADMEAVLEARNLDRAAMESTAGLVSWVAIDLLFGILSVFAYAAIRPRFGAGPRTAVIAALMIYVAATLVVYSFHSMGMFPAAMFWKMSVAWLVLLCAGTVAGAWVYRE